MPYVRDYLYSITPRMLLWWVRFAYAAIQTFVWQNQWKSWQFYSLYFLGMPLGRKKSKPPPPRGQEVTWNSADTPPRHTSSGVSPEKNTRNTTFSCLRRSKLGQTQATHSRHFWSWCSLMGNVRHDLWPLRDRRKKRMAESNAAKLLPNPAITDVFWSWMKAAIHLRLASKGNYSELQEKTELENHWFGSWKKNLRIFVESPGPFHFGTAKYFSYPPHQNSTTSQSLLAPWSTMQKLHKSKTK